MLQTRSIRRRVDNSDVLEIRCFSARGKRGKRGGGSRKLGDLVSGAVTKVNREPQGGKGGRVSSGGSGSKGKGEVVVTHKRGDVVHAVIVGTKYRQRSGQTGILTSFQENRGVLVVDGGKEGWVPVGSRLSRTVPRSLRTRGWGNILARAEDVV
jgi:ribosomal protein L14